MSLTSQINRVSMWVQANKLTLNPAKSNLLIITPKFNFPSANIDIQCTDGIIKSVNTIKYLGMLVEDKLIFSDHIKVLKNKVFRSEGILCSPKNVYLKMLFLNFITL